MNVPSKQRNFVDYGFGSSEALLDDIDRRIGEILEPYKRRVGHPETQPEGARTAIFIELGFPIPDEPPP